MVVLLVFLAFIFGAVTVVAVEALALWLLICHLSEKKRTEAKKAKAEAEVSVAAADFNPSLHDKQGDVWILEPEKVPLSRLVDKLLSPPDLKRRIETLEVAPVRKYARIKAHYLILTESDGSHVEILLRGCSILAVSATSLSTKKWAKRYPIKVENKDSAIYKGHKIIYIYLETSWEKESWCKALRLASCDDKVQWFSKLSSEFHNYLVLLNAGYPSLMKPSGILSPELMEKSVNLDNSSSKVRQFLKKLTKKASKNGQEYKANGISSAGNQDRKLSARSQSSQDLFLGSSFPKVLSTVKSPNPSFDDVSVASSTSNEQGSKTHLSRTSNTDSDYNNFDGGNLDGGVQCLNLVISRLFFDANNNPQILSFVQNRIQRTLSNMRIPNYIGEVTCTSMNLGTLPPRILAMRLLPSDMNEVLSLEIDIEYIGGTVLDFATRLEMRELELDGEGTRVDTNTVDEVTSDLLEGFEHIGKQLKLSEETIDEIKQKVEDHGSDETENSKSTAGASSQLPKWKSILRSITKQVTQVPLSLGVRISSLRGTLRLCIKPPPSDQLWYGFISMPDIEFNLESYVGDHKVTNTHLAFFLVNRFKAGIRDTMVLPNRESVGISWMLAERDDWVPKKEAPFMWYRPTQDSNSNSTKRVIPCCQPGEAAQTIEGTSHSTPEATLDKPKFNGSIPEITSESLGHCASSSSSMNESTVSDGPFQELRAPLLEKTKLQDFCSTRKEDKPDIPKPDVSLHSRSLAAFSERSNSSGAEDDDSRLRRLGTRERMRGLGKKMGEKLEVKRRHIEEKGRSLVEKMRGPT